MTYESAEKLDLANSDTDFIPWKEVEDIQKEKIERAIATKTPPNFLISPNSEKYLAQAVKFACEKHLSIIPCGNGSKLSWGGLVKEAQLVVSTQHLNQIIDHAVGDLTATVEAGVKLCDLQKVLMQSNQFLPLDPAYPDSATIGGIVATADSGSWRQRYGGVRDMVLGLSFVRADGEMAKAGGRVVKNVAGYDLMKLFTGSYGTLGIISQVTFRLYPLPEASGTMVLTGETNAIATATQIILNSSLTPAMADVLSSSSINSLDMGKEIGLILRFQSIQESVKEQLDKVAAIASQLGLKMKIIEQQDEINLWQRLQQIIRMPSSEGAITCKLGVMPNQAVNFLENLDRLTNNRELAKINISSGLGQIQIANAEIGQIQKMRSLLQEMRGFLTILEAPFSIKQNLEPWGYTGNSLDMMKRIKEKFDPNNMFSSGRFFS
jgi:glycolate oxidase FAD binding subunit